VRNVANIRHVLNMVNTNGDVYNAVRDVNTERFLMTVVNVTERVSVNTEPRSTHVLSVAGKVVVNMVYKGDIVYHVKEKVFANTRKLKHLAQSVIMGLMYVLIEVDISDTVSYVVPGTFAIILAELSLRIVVCSAVQKSFVTSANLRGWVRVNIDLIASGAIAIKILLLQFLDEDGSRKLT
jgi:hypothetical protein